MHHNKPLEVKHLADCQEHIMKLAKLWYEGIAKKWVPNASIERAKSNLHMHLNRNKLPFTEVALINNEPVGMASLRDNDGIRPDLAPWLGTLVVDPKYRRRKIGEHLIEVIKKNAKQMGYASLYLLAFDPTIPSWYASLGWKSVGEDKLFGHLVAVMCIEL